MFTNIPKIITMKYISSRVIMCLGGVLLLPVESSGGAVLQNYSLGTSQETTIWTNLSNANPSMSPASGTGVTSVTAPGFRASVGLYSFSGSYSTTTTQGSTFDAQSVIFQADLSYNSSFSFPFSGGPILSFNGGAQNIVPSLFGVSGSENRITSFGPQTYTGAVWQWDLTGYAEILTPSLSLARFPYIQLLPVCKLISEEVTSQRFLSRLSLVWVCSA
ncbi:MAG: hypothetical protein HC767_06155 [Akkermansiaceae bacterium]|nr:hypothetical protein [Akkermansiaceae bacterium]